MSKEVFARLITTFIQSQVGVRELGTRPMICVPGVFFSVRSGVNSKFGILILQEAKEGRKLRKSVSALPLPVAVAKQRNYSPFDASGSGPFPESETQPKPEIVAAQSRYFYPSFTCSL